MPIPSDPIAHVKTLHAEYQARTGYTIIFNMYRERQWSEWCRWADWTWTPRELAIVISYLREKINKGERNDGALKFDQLIGLPQKFEEDLNLANEARKGNLTFRAKPRQKTASKSDGITNSFGDEIHAGKEAALNFAELLKQES